jgi:hypothetical protein
MRLKLIDRFTDFGKGVISGLIMSAILFGLTLGVILHRIKVKEIVQYAVEYAEKQIELQILQEDVINRDPVEFFEIPGVRGAVDGAAADFDRRLDEDVYRFRNLLAD